MVAARAAVLDGGLFAPLSAALAERRGADVVLDIGAGTGHHLAAVLGDGAVGIALDTSPPALRRAVRAHPAIAAVRADIWRQLPLGDATVDLALNVFAPRNPAEIARVLRPGGTLLVVTPAPGHLGELAALHGVGIDPRKAERLQAALAPLLAPEGERRIGWELQVSRAEAAALVRMGPGAHHLDAPPEERLAACSEPLHVTAAVDVHAYRAAG
jgi:SAM-dependent methyltransferase